MNQGLEDDRVGSSLSLLFAAKGVLDEKDLLRFDGHTTHSLNLEFIAEMRKKIVILWCFPPHNPIIYSRLIKTCFRR